MFNPIEYKNKLVSALQTLTGKLNVECINKYLHDGINLHTRHTILHDSFPMSFIIPNSVERCVDIKTLYDALLILPKPIYERHEEELYRVLKEQQAKTSEQLAALRARFAKCDAEYRSEHIDPHTKIIREQIADTATIVVDNVSNAIKRSEEYKKFISDVASNINNSSLATNCIDSHQEMVIPNLGSNATFKINPIVVDLHHAVSNVSTKLVVEASICSDSMEKINCELASKSSAAKLTSVKPTSSKYNNYNAIKCQYFGTKG